MLCANSGGALTTFTGSGFSGVNSPVLTQQAVVNDSTAYPNSVTYNDNTVGY